VSNVDGPTSMFGGSMRASCAPLGAEGQQSTCAPPAAVAAAPGLTPALGSPVGVGASNITQQPSGLNSQSLFAQLPTAEVRGFTYY